MAHQGTDDAAKRSGHFEGDLAPSCKPILACTRYLQQQGGSSADESADNACQETCPVEHAANVSPRPSNQNWTASGETVWLPDELIRDLAEIASAAGRAEAAVGEADAHAELAERYAADAVGAATTAAGAASTATSAAESADSAATRSAAVLDEILAYEPTTATPGDGTTPGFLFLGEDEEVPAGKKPGTLIFRSAAIVAEPELGLSIVTSGAQPFTAEGTSYSIARPSGLAVGDVLLVALTHQALSTTTEPFLAPSGFVRLAQDSQFPTPDGYRPTALYALPIIDEATLAAVPATIPVGLKPEFSFGRTPAVAFRVTGADLVKPLAGSTGFTSASSPTTVPLKPLTSETADGVELALFASQATGGRVPDVLIDGMTREFVVNMSAATGSTTSLVVFSAPMTSTAAEPLGRLFGRLGECWRHLRRSQAEGVSALLPR